MLGPCALTLALRSRYRTRYFYRAEYPSLWITSDPASLCLNRQLATIKSMQAPSSLRCVSRVQMVDIHHGTVGALMKERLITSARPPPSRRPRRCPCPSPRGSPGHLVHRDRLRASRPAPLDAIISGHQWSSVVIKGHQWSSVVISGHQRSSVAIRGRGHQWSSAHLLHLMQPGML